MLPTTMRNPLDGKRVLVGVGGSIAAYRACDVVRRLRELGATVRVAPTRAASAFVTPMTFEALAGAPCLGGVLEVERGRIPHVEEAHACDVVLVAAATADLLAKMAQGLADEALLATLLAFPGPVVVAPAMESGMWSHAATQANVATLRARGVHVVGPVEGPLASGRSGAGRMAPVDDLVEAAAWAVCAKDLAGKQLVITAGPTVEDLDPVRFLSNRSSGRMGVALAVQAARRGAQVVLVHGPLKVAVPNVPGLTAVAARAAGEMHEETVGRAARADAAILCAAVADARPRTQAKRKLKKSEGQLKTIELVPTRDILADLGAARRKKKARRPVLVGFAAETGDVLSYARGKLEQKGCDLICANDVAEAGSGFDVDTNRMLLVWPHEERWLPACSKDEAAWHILDEVAVLLSRTTRRRS
ncbi:MAG: bifunctional phosphopantothenoylcysteine decarboxylase/phosphopantothenate--cysteine ligase CoaBC [Deltaproteobacteria bacterium]|nr:bifunctional phosphopantothenoylcysteine decarboxylase/phosphopantothenate--cysteine ligase CoaBC [Deltaproteobacteria bacterium]